MKAFSRRDMLKTSLLAPAVAAAAHGITPVEAAMHAASEAAGPLPAEETAKSAAAQPGSQRERCCSTLDGAFISAMPVMQIRISDSAADERATSKRRADFSLPVPLPSMTATGSRSICRTTGRLSCPFRTIPRFSAKASIHSAATIPPQVLAGTGASLNSRIRRGQADHP